MPYQNRLSNVQRYMEESDLDLVVVEEPIMLYYLTGLHFSAGTLLVHKTGADLLVDGRYVEIAAKGSPFPVTLKKPETLKEKLAEAPYSTSKRVGFDANHTPFQGYSLLTKIFNENGIDAELVGINRLFEELRMVKDEQEVALLAEVAALGSEGYDYVCEILREGITEKEVATELEIFWKRKGAQRLSFDPIIAFGANSSMPHYHPGDVKLEKNQPVLIDIGCMLNDYCSDMTRVVFFGDPDPKMVEIYELVKKAQQAGLDACRPGVYGAEVDKASRDVIEAAGYGDHFQHGLGHGVGLEIHESPLLRNDLGGKGVRLEPGMCVTVEPGVYLPGLGGVRIEDTIVITENGFQDLTKRSKDLRILSTEQQALK